MTTRPSVPIPPSPADPPAAPPLHALQLGMGWVSEHGGNGLDRMFFGLTSHLPDAGVRVSGWVTGTDAVASDSGGRVRAFAPPSASLARRLWSIRRSLRATEALADADLIATHFALYSLPLLDLTSDRPFVVHFHGPWASESAAEGASSFNVHLKQWIERTVYRQADRFIVLSTAFRDVLTSHYGIDPRLIRVVPGGVDVERFAVPESQKEARQILDLPSDRPLIVSVRRLVRRTGLEALIHAVDTLRHAEPDVLLLIAGRGPLAASLDRLIQERELRRHVRLLGFVPDADLPLLYRAADVSIVPSIAWEGFGLIAAESLAAGTPVLVTPVGGLPEVVAPLEEALILEDKTPDALSHGLRDAMCGALPLPTAAQCQQYARHHFAWPVIARRTRDIYHTICS